MIQDTHGIGLQDPSQAAQDRTLAAAEGLRAKREAGLKQLRDVAQSMESVFLNMLLSSMRKTVKKSEFFDGGRGEEVFTNLLDMTISERASRRGGGIGIADMIVEKYGKHVRGAEGPQGSSVDLKQ